MDASFLTGLQRELTQAQTDFTRRFPGDSGARQPVSVLYGGAHLFKSDTPQKLGALALKALHDFAVIIGGGAPRLWILPWVEAWRHGGSTETPPGREYQRFITDVAALTTEPNSKH